MTDDEVAAVINDPTPWAFFKYVYIQHRATRRFIPFDPTPEQRDWIQTMLDNQEVINLKSRNVGIGTATQAFHFWRAWRCAWHGDGIATLVVAHAEDTAKVHLQRYKDMNERLPDEMRLEIGRVSGSNNDTDFKLCVPRAEGDARPDEYAWFRAVTAGGKKGEGKGFTQQQLHCTEFAMWERAAAIFGSLTSAMHESDARSVVIESTPQGTEGFFPELYGRCKDGKTTMVARFYAWTLQPSFTKEPPPDFERDPEEEALVAIHGLTDGQLYWRRGKLEKMTKDAFMDDFPLTEAEAFRSAEATYFDSKHLAKSMRQFDGRTTHPKGHRVFRHPEPGFLYAVAVDTSGGVGADDAVIQVIDNTYRQVACFSDNRTRPDILADIAVEYAIRYGNARLFIEGNGGFGAEAVERARELGYKVDGTTLWGNAVKSNRDEIFGFAKLQVDRGRVTLFDYHTIKDMLAFTESRKRKHNGRGGHNDHAMAMIYAVWMASKLSTIDALRTAEIRRRFSPANNLSPRYGP